VRSSGPRPLPKLLSAKLEEPVRELDIQRLSAAVDAASSGFERDVAPPKGNSRGH